MSGSRNWPHAIDMGRWMDQQEKRMMHTERRSVPRTASDLLGPGVGPTATQVWDWNSDAMGFNGIYYSEPGAINGPDITRYWMGFNLVNAEGSGIQKVWEYTGAPATSAVVKEMERTFVTLGTSRTYTVWAARDEDMHHVGDPGEIPFENGWENVLAGSTGCVYRREGDVVRLGGAIKNGTGTMFTLPAGYRPLYYEIDYANKIRVDLDGTVKLVTDGANTFVPLTGFTFYARQ